MFMEFEVGSLPNSDRGSLSSWDGFWGRVTSSGFASALYTPIPSDTSLTDGLPFPSSSLQSVLRCKDSGILDQTSP